MVLVWFYKILLKHLLLLTIFTIVDVDRHNKYESQISHAHAILPRSFVIRYVLLRRYIIALALCPC